MNFADFANRFNGRIDVPPLKMNMHALIESFADDDLTPGKVASTLYHYPVINARLLGVANSAWSKPISRITDIESACIRLGLSTVKSISLALAIASSFDTKRCQAFDSIRFWTTSLLVAESSALFAMRLTENADYSSEIKFLVQTAGLIHNLGLLWLASNLEHETDRALKLATANPELSVNQALRECIGIDYCMAGAWLFKQWKLPDELINVIANHRSDFYWENAHVEVILVGTAAELVSSLCNGENQTSNHCGLAKLGIEADEQNIIFEQIANKLDATRELAKTLSA